MTRDSESGAPDERVAKVSIPYYVVVKGYGYWRPKANMKALGFQRVTCGRDGPDAWKIAEGWNRKWQAVRNGTEQPPSAVVGQKIDRELAEDAYHYPRGSFGAGFREYRKTDEWKNKAPATRDDWWRAWKRIKPVFGDKKPRHVTLLQLSKFRTGIKDGVSQREAHRVIKIWRALWQVMAAMRHCRPDEDPSAGVTNTAADGRSETWTEGEVVRMIKRAWRRPEGRGKGLAAALAVLWDSSLSPVDVRLLTRAQLARTAGGRIFFTDRQKTDVKVCGALSKRTSRAIDGYLDSLGFELHDDAPIFRTPGAATTISGGKPWAPRPFTKDYLAKEFRELRTEEFGKEEKRQMRDYRRSGAVEAVVGGSTRDELGKAMGNGIAKSDELWETYVPVNVEMLNAHQAKRKIGRGKLRENESELKVPTRRSGQSQLGAKKGAK